MSRNGHVLSVNPDESEKTAASKRRNSLSNRRKRKGVELKEIENSRKWGSTGDKRNLSKGKIGTRIDR